MKPIDFNKVDGKRFCVRDSSVYSGDEKICQCDTKSLAEMVAGSLELLGDMQDAAVKHLIDVLWDCDISAISMDISSPIRTEVNISEQGDDRKNQK